MEKMADRSGQTRLIIILGLLLIINFSLFYWPGFPVNLTVFSGVPLNQIPDLDLRFSPGQVYDFLTKIGADGRQTFRMIHLSIDLTFPIVYSLFFFLLLKSLTQKLNLESRFIPYIAFLAGAIDLSENFLLNYLTRQYPVYHPTLTVLVEIITIFKFSLLLMCIFLSAYFWLRSTKLRPGNK